VLIFERRWERTVLCGVFRFAHVIGRVAGRANEHYRKDKLIDLSVAWLEYYPYSPPVFRGTVIDHPDYDDWSVGDDDGVAIAQHRWG